MSDPGALAIRRSSLLIPLAAIALAAAIVLLLRSLELDFLLLVGAGVVVVLLFSGPVICLAALTALNFSGLQIRILGIGGADLTLADAFYLAMVFWSLHPARDAAGTPPAARAARLSVRPLVPFLAFIGLSLITIILEQPERFSLSLISWLRLVQTASLVWVVPRALRSERDGRVILKVLRWAALGALVMALNEVGIRGAATGMALGARLGSGRYGMFMNENSFGLVMGLLILLAVFTPRLNGRCWRAVMLLLGVAGLVLAKSVGAGLSTVTAITVGTLFRSGVRRGLPRFMKAAAALAIIGTAAFLYVTLLRPAELPDSPGFLQGTFAVRSMLAMAGWEIFLHHPLMGVGWQRSWAPEVIGAEDIDVILQRWFPQFVGGDLPATRPSSVHNAYVQVLAELGLAGFALFAWGIWRLGTQIRRTVRALPEGTPARELARYFSFAILVILLWWNTNPIYGGQTETVGLALFLGALSHLASTQPGLARRCA